MILKASDCELKGTFGCVKKMMRFTKMIAPVFEGRYFV
jgi:hypothetical protein